MPEHSVEVLATGALTLLQDEGRAGFAHLGVTASGAADRAAYRAANRLVGNAPGAAVLESVLGGIVLRVRGGALLVAVTGATASVTVHRGGGLSAIEHPVGCSITLGDGETLEVGTPVDGLRTMLAVRGGLDVDAVLGSRSRDVLSGIGPAPLRPGDVLPVGGDAGKWPAAELLPAAIGRRAGSVLTVIRGPRDDRFGDAGWQQLLATEWTVAPASNRVGLRLAGAPLVALPGSAELPSEGMVAGAVQVPPGGLPVVFLRDHPVTGGYPVIGVLTRDAIDVAAQLRPGDPARFVAVQPAPQAQPKSIAASS